MSIFTPRPNHTKGATYPPPVDGMSSQAPGYGMKPANCIYTYNLMPGERGMTVRDGHRVHQTGLGQEVRTLIPLTAINREVNTNRLFATTIDGIYDVSLSGEDPILMLAFSSAASGGYGHFVNFTNDAGDDFILYADSRNGLCIYTAGTDTWAFADQADYTGVDVANVAFVMNHKQRIWLIERSSTDAWYLPLASFQGDATKFRFGAKFKYGGELVGLYNFTMDGGDGVDDYLVALSRAGDVIVYRGEDPSSIDSWNVVGTFYVGEVPSERRVANEYGGDLYIISSFGLISLAAVMTGVAQLDYDNHGLGEPISKIIRNHVADTMNQPGWDIVTNPSGGTFMLLSPIKTEGKTLQYVMNQVTHGWGFNRGLPMSCAESWTGSFYFGTPNGEVCEHTTNEDGGEPIEYSILLAYQDMGAPERFKRVQYMRPHVYNGYSEKYALCALYDFEDANICGLDSAEFDLARWDEGIWDTDVWGGKLTPAQAVRGGEGIGIMVSIAMRGVSSTPFTIVGWGVIADIGGMM